jgi:hypothetical protein
MAQNETLAPAVLPAELLEPATITAELRHYGTRRTTEGLFRSAWNHLEFGLNRHLGLDDEVRDSYFDLSQYLVGRILYDHSAHQDTQLGALILSTYMPLFAKRGSGEKITGDDCLDIYKSIGHALQYLQPLHTDEPPQWPMTEAAVLALSARTKQPHLLLFPSSPREECDSVRDQNHDSYFLSGLEKIPIQQKLVVTDKEYSKWITILCLEPIVQRGLRKSGTKEAMGLADSMNYLISLIIAESSGGVAEEHERAFLDHISSAIVSHRRRSELDLVA